MPTLNTNRVIIGGRIISRLFIKSFYKKKSDKKKKGRYLFFYLENRISNYHTQTIPVKAFGQCAMRIATYCRKRDYLQIEGTLRTKKRTIGKKQFYEIEFYGENAVIDYEQIYRKRKLENKAKEKGVSVEEIWQDNHKKEVELEEFSLQKEMDKYKDSFKGVEVLDYEEIEEIEIKNGGVENEE